MLVALADAGRWWPLGCAKDFLQIGAQMHLGRPLRMAHRLLGPQLDDWQDSANIVF